VEVESMTDIAAVSPIDRPVGPHMKFARKKAAASNAIDLDV
jgi:hypothetical protein